MIPPKDAESQELADESVSGEVSEEPPPGRKDLPERIVINSVRLLNFLDFNVYDGSLTWSHFGPFTILRPFKLLVFLNDKIRHSLLELEVFRSAREPATE